jgi:hypothetical protein
VTLYQPLVHPHVDQEGDHAKRRRGLGSGPHQTRVELRYRVWGPAPGE